MSASFDPIAYWKVILTKRLADFRSGGRDESGRLWEAVIRARQRLYALGVVPE